MQSVSLLRRFFLVILKVSRVLIPQQPYYHLQTTLLFKKPVISRDKATLQSQNWGWFLIKNFAKQGVPRENMSSETSSILISEENKELTSRDSILGSKRQSVGLEPNGQSPRQSCKRQRMNNLETAPPSARSGTWAVSDSREEIASSSDNKSGDEVVVVYENITGRGSPEVVEINESEEVIMIRRRIGNTVPRHTRRRHPTVVQNLIRSFSSLEQRPPEDQTENCVVLSNNTSEGKEKPEVQMLDSLSPPLKDKKSTSSVEQDNHPDASSIAHPLSEETGKHHYEYLKKKLQTLRQWEYTRLGTSMKEQGFRTDSRDMMFTLMSYNVLSQDLLEAHPYLYQNCDPRTVQWDYRKEELLRQIEEADCDILCLQEVHVDHYSSFFEPVLRGLGYEGLYKKKTHKKMDGCALFWRRSLFSLRYHASVEFFQPGVEVLDRDNVALVAKLQTKSRGHHISQSLVIATTHLLYNPKRHDVKLAQLQLLSAEMDRLAFVGWEGRGRGRRPRYLPMVLAGDLNLEPYSQAYEFITSGQLEYQGLVGRTLSPFGKGKLLNGFLVPSYLQVDDWCRHRLIQDKRESHMYPDQNEARNQDLVRLYHSENKSPWHQALHNNSGQVYPGHPFDNFLHGRMNPTPETSAEEAPSACFGSGCLSHQLALKSVYGHRLYRLAGKPEVTSKQNYWTTVDYIFYGMSWSDKHNKRVEGRLKLIGKYGLLSGNECDRLGEMPNLVSPSDHFPLLAKFFLRS